MSDTNRCPVCLQRVTPTACQNIGPHMDTLGREECLGSGEPYRIAMLRRRSKVLRRQHVGTTYPFQVIKATHRQPGSDAHMVAIPKQFDVANQTRSKNASWHNVIAARKAIKTLAQHDGQNIPGVWRTTPKKHLRTLVARVEFPDQSLTQIANHLGITKDTYAAALRRALDYAATLEARAAKTVIGK